MPTTTITPEAATEPGALDGFRIDCSDCGFVGKSSLTTHAEATGAAHLRWHSSLPGSIPLAGAAERLAASTDWICA